MTLLVEHPTTTFPAPDDTTAPAPAEWRGRGRDEVRMLVARPDGVSHARFGDLADHLSPGDLVVVNDSATEARQLDADMVGRGRVVVHLAQRLDSGWALEIRSAPDASRAVLDASEGDVVVTGGLRATLLEPYPDGRTSSPTGEGNRLWRAEITGDVAAELEGAGRPIAYGYLDRRYPLSAYQTVFGRRPGSAEMPSAARPFTQSLVTDLVSRGIQIAPITLHTGVSSQEAGEAPGAEWFEVSETTARVVEQTRLAGGRVVAAGTTVTRALESAVVEATGVVRAASGWTDRVVTPANPPYVVNGLITGWHDPQASHLLLVEAVAGTELTQSAYDAAVAEGYLWHEFGDSALLLP
ncbi:S-adenosylmethionine:tRNA ribosyltransferase-isomerase [Nocardioides albertanoniae]|uniref:S-adenosylmethionine:tRNA ribosyltransferase-isomerase n=1 Tax=Nocardioides albertanoniae TaxID=1175486 RepID=A0A543A7U3_9ACTN|nr:S-adenosylmethionine:tRNA ribosyltransferase-isomerase [Nocardioides albertanoniae]TQL68657.1 S-adenosylmethionine:tRNA ribosyltransferase-isomerase [Nocardioides albertanoniae]